jgi:hypothetical protein
MAGATTTTSGTRAGTSPEPQRAAPRGLHRGNRSRRSRPRPRSSTRRSVVSSTRTRPTRSRRRPFRRLHGRRRARRVHVQVGQREPYVEGGDTSTLMVDGTLYVAVFDDDQTGEWVPLLPETTGMTEARSPSSPAWRARPSTPRRWTAPSGSPSTRPRPRPIAASPTTRAAGLINDDGTSAPTPAVSR